LPAEGGFGPAAPPYWLAYVETEDADAVASDVVGLGGEVLVKPFDVPRIGRIALFAGRSGDTFAVMQMPADDR
jgi:predicted enzyme related to lactoylglutathione lyase